MQGAISLTGASATLANTGATVLGNATLTGTLSVTGTGAISQAGGSTLTVQGNATFSAGAGTDVTLDATGNQFSSLVSVSQGRDATINNGAALQLGTVKLTGEARERPRLASDLRVAAFCPVRVEGGPDQQVLRIVGFRRRCSGPADALRWAVLDVDRYRWQTSGAAGARTGSFVQLIEYQGDDLLLRLAPMRQIKTAVEKGTLCKFAWCREPCSRGD